MKAWAVLFGVAAAAVLIAMVWLSVWSGMPIPSLVVDAGLLDQLADAVLILVLVAVLAVGAARTAGPIVGILGWAALVIGVLASLRGLLVIWTIASETHTTKLMVVAPSLAQSLLPLGLGLLAVTAASSLGGRAPPASPV